MLLGLCPSSYISKLKRFRKNKHRSLAFRYQVKCSTGHVKVAVSSIVLFEIYVGKALLIHYLNEINDVVFSRCVVYIAYNNRRCSMVNLCWTSAEIDSDGFLKPKLNFYKLGSCMATCRSWICPFGNILPGNRSKVSVQQTLSIPEIREPLCTWWCIIYLYIVNANKL